jgi:uncharacterized membrane protein
MLQVLIRLRVVKLLILIGPSDSEEQLKRLEREKERLEKEYEELKKSFEKGEVGKEEYEKRKHDIEREFVEVMDRIVQYKAFSNGF